MPQQVFAGFDSHPLLEKAEKSIWRICNNVTKVCGTGFFIDDNTFITNLHVINGSLLEYRFGRKFRREFRRNIRLSEFYLKQKDTKEKLSLKSIQSLSIPYDLIVLETNEPVEDYLSLTGDFDYGSGGFSISYTKSKFTKAYSVGNVTYEDDYVYEFIALLEGTSDLSMYMNRFAGGSGSPILNRKAEVVGVLTRASYNSLRGMKASLLNNMLTADESFGIGFIECKELNINFCFMKHRQAFVDYILAETNGLTVPPEEVDPDLGFYLYRFVEEENVMDPISINKYPFYRRFLELSAGLNYQPAVIQQGYIKGFLEGDHNILYDLIVSSDYFSLISYYMENFYNNETEDRKRTLKTSLISCAKRRFWPCETALSQLKPRLYFTSLE